MRSRRLVASECSLSGRGQGHVSNFYITNLENYLPQQVIGIQVISTTRPWSVYDTYETMKALGRVMVECTCLLGLHVASN